jgi:serine/threonine-protein phosphatase 2A regulatory subunit B
MKIWDVNMESKPIKTINIHDYVQPKLVDLYDNECLFDRFECLFSGDGKYFFSFNIRYVLSGSYSNYFHIYDKSSKNEVTLQADKSAFKMKKGASNKGKGLSLGRKNKKEEINVDTVDFTKKILHGSWHPQEYTVAVAATNNLYLFSAI